MRGKRTKRISQLFNSLPTNHINQAIRHLSDYHVSRSFFLAWLLAFVKSFARLFSQVDGLFMDNRKTFSTMYGLLMSREKQKETNYLIEKPRERICKYIKRHARKKALLTGYSVTALVIHCHNNYYFMIRKTNMCYEPNACTRQ